VLVDSGALLNSAYFPHDGVICLMAAMRKGGAETATVGPEGFIGFEALLGGKTASQRVLVQVAGTASRLPIRTLVDAAHGNARLQSMLLGYVRYFLIQVLQSVACNGQHSVQERFGFRPGVHAETEATVPVNNPAGSRFGPWPDADPSHRAGRFEKVTAVETSTWSLRVGQHVIIGTAMVRAKSWT